MELSTTIMKNITGRVQYENLLISFTKKQEEENIVRFTLVIIIYIFICRFSHLSSICNFMNN